MKALFLAVTVVLLTASVSVSQSSVAPAKEVVWQAQDSCAENSSVDINARAPVCQRIETNRGIFYVATFEGVSVAIAPSPQNLYVQALVQITNHSNTAINFDPLVSTIDVYKAESEFRSRSVAHRNSAAITGDKAEAKYIQSLTAAVAAPPPASVASPGIQAPTRTITSVDAKRSDMSTTRPDGTIGTKAETLVVMAPGSQGPASPSVPSSPTTTRRTASASALLMFDKALHSQTIASEGKVAGYIFFEPVREKMSYKVFRVKVGDITFVFPDEVSPAQKK